MLSQCPKSAFSASPRQTESFSRDMPESSRGGASSCSNNVSLAIPIIPMKCREELSCEIICEEDHVPLDYLVYNGHNPHVILCGFVGGSFKSQHLAQRGSSKRKKAQRRHLARPRKSPSPKSELTRLISERDGLGLSRDTRTVLWYLLCPKSNFNRMVAMKHWRHFN